MAGRTFAVGDIHGDMRALRKALAKLPPLDERDTLVFLGDYVDRGPDSAGVVAYVRHTVREQVKAKVIALRGNHEDGWLRVVTGGWPEFVIPAGNGCLATLRSFEGKMYFEGDMPTKAELDAMRYGTFLAEDLVDWMAALPVFYEDEHAIYVHAGLVEEDGKFLHPKDTPDPRKLMWTRNMRFFELYQGKRVVCGHTSTDNLPPDLSDFTPEDPADMWLRDPIAVIDTGAGKGGFLTILELPSMTVYESRG
jgi:serine/threonine protein phosphatase 1